MTGLQPTSVDELPENLLHGLFPLAPEGELPVPVYTHGGLASVVSWLRCMVHAPAVGIQAFHRRRCPHTSASAWPLVPRSWGTRRTPPVNRVIAEPWRQCFAVSPANIGQSEYLVSDEELDLVQGYMDRPFHDCVSQREGKGHDKARWEVDAIIFGSYDGNTFVRRVLDHMSS